MLFKNYIFTIQNLVLIFAIKHQYSMNYLAHIYLSGNNDLLKIGNFMADGIKGNDFENYQTEIKKGILLHRHIDSFTDSNLIYRKSKHRLHEKYGHYSGVIMDVFYDHFLAKNWKHYHSEELTVYVEKFYQILKNNYALLTQKIQKIVPIMIENNWLASYQTIAGIELILFQMDYRTKFESKMQFSTHELLEYYEDFEKEFSLFFDELQHSCKNKIRTLNRIY